MQTCAARVYVLLQCLTLCLASCGDDINGDGSKPGAVTENAGSSAPDVDAGSTSPTEPDAVRDAGPTPAKDDDDAGAAPTATAAGHAADPAPSGGAGASGAGASGTGVAGQPAEPAAVGEIDTVMVDLVLISTAGGSFGQDPRPVVLYRDGTACRDMNVVVADTDLATHRAMNPGKWTEWKVVDGKVSLLKNGAWSPLYFQVKYAPNSDLTFDGKIFLRPQGATLGDVTIASYRYWRFSADHKIELSSDTAVWSSSSAFGSVPPAQRATYRIEGYQITLNWDDGRTEKLAFAHNAEKDANAIYMGGFGFVVQN